MQGESENMGHIFAEYFFMSVWDQGTIQCGLTWGANTAGTNG